MTRHESLIAWALAAALLPAVTAFDAQAQSEKKAPEMETFWNCKDKDGKASLTNLEKDTIGKECVMVQKQRLTVAPSARPASNATPATQYAKDAAYRTQVDSFRASLKPGDKTDQGLVIEVKAPIVRVQRPHGDHWVRVEELFPQ
jgi:hypothetical protein